MGHSVPTDADRALSPLPPPEKAGRAGSFGAVATDYERHRPGPPVAAVDWLLPAHVGRVVDLGAGTGALSRLLVDRADEVVAVEPDDRMRSVLTENVPGIRAVAGRGESMPLADGSVDAVLASSSWHWMDPVPTLIEVGRVLVPGGVLGALWSGPDPEGPFIAQARSLLAGSASGRPATAAGQAADGPAADGPAADDPAADDPAADDDGDRHSGEELAGLILGEADRPQVGLEIPPGVPFDQPDRRVFTGEVALDADELIGLLGTFSWIITMPEQKRAGVIAEARRVLAELLGVEGEVTVDVAFRAEAWRARRHP